MQHAQIFEQMREDHRQVLGELRALESAATRDGRRAGRKDAAEGIRRVLDHMRRQFDTHMAAEDEVLYPALQEALPQTVANIGLLRGEHDTLRTMLAQLEATIAGAACPERDEQLAVQIRDFVDLLRIHIRKEEALVISVAERVLRPREVEALAARMSRGERGAGTGTPRAGRSKGANK